MTKYQKLNELLILEDLNDAIIELDNFICELCDYGESLDREINNGGFNQYFINSSGDNSHETILSLKSIGADKTATILQKAIEQFPDKAVPKDRDERIEVVEQIEEIADEIWSELDEKFYEYEDDLNSLNIEYIKKYKDFF